jgi:hypothetical protein
MGTIHAKGHSIRSQDDRFSEGGPAAVAAALGLISV